MKKLLFPLLLAAFCISAVSILAPEAHSESLKIEQKKPTFTVTADGLIVPDDMLKEYETIEDSMHLLEHMKYLFFGLATPLVSLFVLEPMIIVPTMIILSYFVFLPLVFFNFIISYKSVDQTFINGVTMFFAIPMLGIVIAEGGLWAIPMAIIYAGSLIRYFLQPCKDSLAFTKIKKPCYKKRKLRGQKEITQPL